MYAERPLRFVLAASLVFALACTKLFGAPSQCKSDGDCAAFPGAVCDTAQNVCVQASAGPASDGSDASPPTSTTPSSNDDAAISPAADTGAAADGPDACASTSKPQAIVGVADGGSSGGGIDIASDTSLTCDKDWILQGTVTVRAGATLTIQRGTTVLGDAATKGKLVVVPGGKLVARGEKDAPIVFTSSKPAGSRAPGDWGGVFVLGSAGPAGQLNALGLPYGGGNAPDDSSGAIVYARIEYAASGVVFGGLGTGTQLEYVQVRRPNDNCFAWYGGTVNAKHLVCQTPADEPFEWNDGYAGKMQFLLAQGTPPDTPNHHGLLVNGAYPTIYNATICGTAGPNQGYGMLLREGAQGHFSNAIVMGWNAGVDVVAPVGTPLELVSSVMFDNHSANVAYVEDPAQTDPNSPLFDDDNGFDEIGWFNTAASKNSESDPGLKCYDPTAPAFGPATALGANAETPPADGFFDATAAYVGAVKDVGDAWATRGAWVVWAAQ